MIELIADHSKVNVHENGIHHIAWIAENFDKEAEELIKMYIEEKSFHEMEKYKTVFPKVLWFDENQQRHRPGSKPSSSQIGEQWQYRKMLLMSQCEELLHQHLLLRCLCDE